MTTISSTVFQATRYIAAALRPATPADYSFGIEEGRRYLKIWKRFRSQDARSVVCFVDAKTGEVFRADSWKKCGRSLGINVNSF